MRNSKLFIIVGLLFCFNLILGGCGITNRGYYNVTQSEQIKPLSIENESFAEIVSPAIVGIKSVSGTSASIGSGVCIKSGGFVATNYHVVSNSGAITLLLSDDSVCSAIVVYKNPDIDIAILKANYPIPYLSMFNSENLKVGEDVYAVGCPLSLNFNLTFTKGIISALNRRINIQLTNSGVNYMDNLIQHDASINSGNSGGPLLNKFGEVVGINTLKITDAEGMGFAIPTKTFKHIVESL